MIESNTIYNEDCLEGMKRIPDKSVDMILCDPPYGTTHCKWDSIIPFEPMWEQYRRIIKDNGAICLFGQEPFSSQLRCSNLKMYRYDWIWDKHNAGGFLNAKKRPLKRTELISVFSIKPPVYYPIMETRGKPRQKGCTNEKGANGSGVYGKFEPLHKLNNVYYPTNILDFSNANRKYGVHPTQKPVPLCEYLIKTYTNEGETVLDNCMGSGTTAIAAMNTGRNFIGFELDDGYYKAAIERISSEVPMRRNQHTRKKRRLRCSGVTT